MGQVRYLLIYEVFFYYFFVRLKRTYREHAASLHQTGNGIRNDDMDRDAHHEYADC